MKVVFRTLVAFLVGFVATCCGGGEPSQERNYESNIELPAVVVSLLEDPRPAFFEHRFAGNGVWIVESDESLCTHGATRYATADPALPLEELRKEDFFVGSSCILPEHFELQGNLWGVTQLEDTSVGFATVLFAQSGNWTLQDSSELVEVVVLTDSVAVIDIRDSSKPGSVDFICDTCERSPVTVEWVS